MNFKRLTDLGSHDRRQVGGKAVGLSRAMSVGARVPPGLCVTTSSFVSMVRRASNQSPTSLDELRAAITDLTPPADVLDQLTHRIPELVESSDGESTERVAVRSSAVREDATDYSYAGQYDSALDVPAEPEPIWRALCQLLAGTFDPDVLSYPSRIRIDGDLPRMAAVIQPMIETSIGGVLFTRDPSQDTRGEIDPAGTGDYIVSVGSSPRHVVSGGRASTWRITDTGFERIRGQSEADASSDSVSHQLDAPLADALRELAHCLDHSPHWSDAPGLDIEWAYDPTTGSGRLWLLQCRSITTSPTGGSAASTDDSDSADAGPEARESVDDKSVDNEPIDDKSTDDAPPVIWSNANVGEALPGVATPLTWSIIGSFSRRGFEQAFGAMGLDVPDDADLVGSFRGRVYLNLTEFVDIASGLPFLSPSMLHHMAGGGGIDLLEEQIDELPSPAFLARLPATLPKIAASQLSMPLVAPVWLRYFRGRVERHFDAELDAFDARDLKEELSDIDWLFDRNGRIMLSAGSNFLVAYVALRLVTRWFARNSLDIEELVGAIDVTSAEPGLELLDIARTIRASAELTERLTDGDPDTAARRLRQLADGRDENGRYVSGSVQSTAADALDQIRQFREQFGHRAPGEAELSTPRWREDVAFVWQVLLGHIRTDELPDRGELERRQQSRRGRLREEITSAFPAGVRDLVRVLWRWTRQAGRIRESLRDAVVESLDLYRSIALEVGRRLSQTDRLPSRDDVFFLRHDEIAGALDLIRTTGSDDVTSDANADASDDFSLRTRALVRRALHERLRELPDPPDTFVELGGDLVDASTYRRRHRSADLNDRPPGDGSSATDGHDREPDAVVTGLTGHGGRIEGIARVIDDPSEAHLESGEILVAPRADVGWTPLFLRAAAIVMELGGPLSHACIVAREYGIPTIVNATDVTDQVRTGDRLLVDATRAKIWVWRRREWGMGNRESALEGSSGK